VRSSLLFTSLLLHAAVLAVAWGVGSYAGRRATIVVPRVELRPTEAAPAVAAAEVIPVPVVDAEAAVLETQLAEMPPFERPEPPPALPPERPFAEAAKPSLLRVVPRPVPPVPVPAPVPSEAQAFVDAVPRADNEPPTFPEHDRVHGHEGNVVVTVAVDEYGFVRSAELRTASPHPGLNREALRAVRSWRFQPAQRGGRAVATTTDVTITFQLRDRE
jgi:protein TonB